MPFRCNSLRRSAPTGPKGRKVPSGPFSPLGQPARFARRLDVNNVYYVDHQTCRKRYPSHITDYSCPKARALSSSNSLMQDGLSQGLALPVLVSAKALAFGRSSALTVLTCQSQQDTKVSCALIGYQCNSTNTYRASHHKGTAGNSAQGPCRCPCGNNSGREGGEVAAPQQLHHLQRR